MSYSEEVNGSASSSPTTKWLKVGFVSNMTFVGRDVVAFGAGCFILLYNTSTQEEVLYTADSVERGEGVQCIVGYQQAYMFAFAETTPQPRIFLVNHPSHEHICVLKVISSDVVSTIDPISSPHTYLAMAFAEMECLVCMTGIPTFEIIVWCWRTGVKLASLPTGISSSNIQLRCSISMPIGVCLLAIMEKCSEFQLWQINICAKLCLLTKTDLSLGGLDADTCVSAFCWSPEGTLMVADLNGSLYLVKQETQNFQKVFDWPYLTREGSSQFPTNTLWWKNGVVMSGPNGFIQFIRRVSSTEFQPGWCVTNEGPLLVMAGNRTRDLLFGWSQKSSLVMLNVNDQNATLEEIKHFGAPVRLLTLVHPADKLVATVNADNTLNIWDITTGDQVRTMDINKGFVLDLQCNPELPYLALARSDGILQIVAVNSEEIFTLNELVLCSEEITGVAFNKSGTIMVAASYKVGRLFVTQGLVGTGNKINVLNHVLTNEQIVNMHIFTTQNFSGADSHKLLVLTKYHAVLDIADDRSPSGNMIVVYILPKLTQENRLVLNTSYTSVAFHNDLLMAAPHISRQIHFLNPLEIIEDSDSVDGISSEIFWESGHKIRRFDIRLDRNHLVTYGWDGLIFLRALDAPESTTPFCILAPHNRFNQGVMFATVDYCAEHVVSLGKEGNLVCSEVSKSCRHKEEDHVINTTTESYFERKPTAAMKLNSITGGTIHQKTWLETQIQQKLNLEASVAAPEIENILTLFKEVQKELVQLLDDNYRAPPEEQLDILEFDLDIDAREALLADAAAERDNTRRLLEAECRDCQRLAEVIRSNTWDTMEVKSRCIKAMLGDFRVENYGLQPQPPTLEVELIWECEARKLSLEMSQGDHFEPWFPFPEETKAVEVTQSVTSPKGDKEDVGESEKENPYLFFGSSSYQFIEISPLHWSQFEISTSFNSVSETVMLQKVCEDLRAYFNKLFDEMFEAKEREMASLADKNARLRTILSELKVTCNAPMEVEEPVDAVWSQEEKTERIVVIEDSEVPEIPYVSPSEQDLLDKKAAEEERIRKLLEADNFRELALIEMMDGMLEVRWEDELKKEVPKPKCLVEKIPEDYNEADLKAIKEYEEKCKILASERERYRKMLEIEYKKLENTIQESLTKFDNSLFQLFQTRLKVDAAMNHEQLKILRIYQLNDDRIRREIQEREIVNNMTQTERETEFAHKQVTLMQEATNECRNNYDALVSKDKALGKRFKQEFVNTPATPAVIEQLAKYFRRRPKLQQRATQYPTLLLELARCVVDSDNTSFMPPEFHEFLSALEALDSPASGQPFDETVWATLVRVRRAKIESELKVRAYALELKEAEYTLSVVIKQMKTAREQANAHVAELKAAKEEKIRLSRDLQVQLVMKQGLVEAPLTGHISDFQYAVLINPKIVENINQHVRAAGAKKLEAMKQVTKYHRINKYKEWQFRKMKMECEDLEDKLNNIESIKVTLEVKQYLKEKDKPIKEKEAQDEDAMFLKQTEENYKAGVRSISDEIKSVKAKMAQLKQLNARADRSILDLKCDVSEQQFERDLELEQTLSDASRRRMAMIVKRSNLVSKIQQVHNENLVLQTELELLRLRTYPTLKYKAPI